MISDPRLPCKVTDLRDVRQLSAGPGPWGEEMTGRAYMLLEGTDASVHYILHDAQLQAARHRGELRPGSFISLRRGRPRRLAVEDLRRRTNSCPAHGNWRPLQSQLRARTTPGLGRFGLGDSKRLIAEAGETCDASRRERGDHSQSGR